MVTINAAVYPSYFILVHGQKATVLDQSIPIFAVLFITSSLLTVIRSIFLDVFPRRKRKHLTGRKIKKLISFAIAKSFVFALTGWGFVIFWLIIDFLSQKTT